MFGKNKKNDLKSYFVILFIIYILSVGYITVFSREPEERRFDMEPFRSYMLLIRDRNYFYLKQIFFNILMTVPLGIFLPLLNKKYRSLRLMTLTGFIFSCGIETIQYITRRGLFEFDDLFNNTIGAAIGYIIFVCLHILILFLIDKNK